MTRATFWLAMIGAVVAGNLALTFAVPYFVTAKAMAKFEQGSAKTGQAITNRPTEKSRAVVKPNPDLLFGVCVFDSAKGPMSVRLRQPAGYWSISVYRSNSSSAAVVSRRDNLPADVALRLFASDEARGTLGERALTVGPGKNAVILRVLPENPADARPERAALESFRCVQGRSAAK